MKVVTLSAKEQHTSQGCW